MGLLQFRAMCGRKEGIAIVFVDKTVIMIIVWGLATYVVHAVGLGLGTLFWMLLWIVIVLVLCHTALDAGYFSTTTPPALLLAF